MVRPGLLAQPLVQVLALQQPDVVGVRHPVRRMNAAACANPSGNQPGLTVRVPGAPASPPGKRSGS